MYNFPVILILFLDSDLLDPDPDSYIESLRWIYKCMQQFTEFSHFLLEELTARFKFVSELNEQFVNIIGETLTNWTDFCSFVSVSPIKFEELYVGKIITKSISEIPCFRDVLV